MKKWLSVRVIVLVLLLAVMIPLVARAVATYTVYITMSGTGGGTIIPSSGTITWSGNTGTTTDNASSMVVFFVNPSLGSTFLSWSGCDYVSDNGTCTLSLTSDNKSLTVNFGGTSVYTLTVNKSGFGTGTVVPSVGTLTWSGNTGTASYNAGQTLVLYQTPGSTSKFSYWTGCDSVSDNGTCSVTMRPNTVINIRFTGYHNVVYSFPYLHTADSAVVYCVVSNFATDNATGDSFTVMSNQQQIPTQTPYNLPTAFTIKRGRTARLTFNNQQVTIDNMSLLTINNYKYLSDNSTTGDNTTSDNTTTLSIAGDTCVNCSYGAKISWTSASATMTSGIDCRSLVMACFQGTTLPKRNLAGYLCSDDSVSGPHNRPNLIGY